MGTILITGATGHLGTAVVANLLKQVQANQISILVRDEVKGRFLKDKRINIKVGNYHDKESLLNAMVGIDKVLLISSSDFNDRLRQHKNVVDAAKKAGIAHIFYTGVAIKDINKSAVKPLLFDHFQTEEHIKASGLTYTFLRNNLYFETIPMFTGENVLDTGIFFPAGEGRVAFASRTDLGAVIATILGGDGHDNKTYSLSGSNTYSFKEIAEEMALLSKKAVTYISPEKQVYEDALRQMGLPEHVVHMSTLFATAIKNNDFDCSSDALEHFLGSKQGTLRNFLKAAFKL